MQVSYSQPSFSGKHVFLIGPPGAGKGKLAEFLLRRKYFHLALGDILRDKSTPIGQQCKPYFERGEPVPNEISFEVFRQTFSAALGRNQLVIVDGMLQTEEDISFFANFIEAHSLEDKCGILFLKLSKEIAKDRILNRIICEGCKCIYSKKSKQLQCQKCKATLIERIDDIREQAIMKRLNRFFEVTLASPFLSRLIEKSKAKSLYLEVDAELDLERLEKEYAKIFDNASCV